MAKASELAKQIYQLEWGQISVIDQALQDMREVIELLAHPKFTTDEAGNIHYYVTKSDVEAARKIYQRLTVPKE